MKLIRIALMMIRRTLLVVYDWGEVYIPPFKIPPGGEVDGGFGIEETFGCLHLLAFMSGIRKEEAKNNNTEGIVSDSNHCQNCDIKNTGLIMVLSLSSSLLLLWVLETSG